jgi:hypothetical protein
MNINLVQANARGGSGSGKFCFVTGHDFSRADCRPYRISALAAAKAQLAENNTAGAKAQSIFHSHLRHD